MSDEPIKYKPGHNPRSIAALKTSHSKKWRKGSHHSKESKVKMAAASQALWDNPEYRARMLKLRNHKYDEKLATGKAECLRCHEIKNVPEDFPRSRRRRDGTARYAYCKKCHSEYQREQRLKYFFLISVEKAETIFSYQNNECAICHKTPKSGQKRLALDHRHSDGLIRGGLCGWCNQAIAKFHDDPARLRAAAEYLENPPATAALGSPHFARPGRVGTKKQRAAIRRENKEIAKKNKTYSPISVEDSHDQV